jgi:acyl-coenzyme A synthetase/AMP-(fatty) acid ligase
MIDNVNAKEVIPVKPVTRDTLAYLVFSSGTSGLPKGTVERTIYYSRKAYQHTPSRHDLPWKLVALDLSKHDRSSDQC